MDYLRLFLACILLPAPAMGQSERVPIVIEIEAGIDFGRIAMNAPGGGEASVDPITGQPQVTGQLTPLGGLALKGTALVTGQPLAAVRIDLPERIEMRSTTGAVAEVIALETDLSPSPMLGSDGRLRFSFGGKMIVKGRVSGQFRGKIRITADYQ